MQLTLALSDRAAARARMGQFLAVHHLSSSVHLALFVYSHCLFSSLSCLSAFVADASVHLDAPPQRPPPSPHSILALLLSETPFALSVSQERSFKMVCPCVSFTASLPRDLVLLMAGVEPASLSFGHGALTEKTLERLS